MSADSSLAIAKHSSIQVNPQLGHYYGGACKYYYVPLRHDCRFPSPAKEILGAANSSDRTAGELRACFVKAKAGWYSHVKIPLDRANDPLVEECERLSGELELPLVLQLCAGNLSDLEFQSYLRALSPETEVELVLDGSSRPTEAEVASVTNHFRAVHLSVPAHRSLRWDWVLQNGAISPGQTIHLYFTYQLKSGEPYLSCLESRKLFLRLKKLRPELNFLGPKGVDIWDRRVKRGLEMEPLLRPCFETMSPAPRIKYSVVIPTYNNQNHLRVTLRHLFRQDLTPDEFEIVVVDDGGTDQTQALVTKLVSEQPASFNFKYIYFPRAQKRTMGDAQFRAGIARNLGSKNAVGEILCFLDSDIVTPPDYLRRVGEQLKDWGALQARRVNLSQSVSHLDCEYENVVVGRDTIADEKYWEEFIKNTKAWHLLPFNWKYVCTHSFSIQRELFWRLGGFKKNFIFYGFEDTDLGYRITKSGHDLHLLDLVVYHLFHESTRSEFMNLSSYRHSLLSRTAQIFYLHHLDEDIFHTLSGFMSPELTFERICHRARQAFTLEFLWRPRAPVFATLGTLRKASKA